MPSDNLRKLKMLKETPPHKRYFFKVLLAGFSTKLVIPLAFSRQLSGESWIEKARLNSCRGSWDVKVSWRSSERMYFGDNCWRDFVKEHHLNVGDFLVFQHHGRLIFDVMVFDRSCCEKDYPPDFVVEDCNNNNNNNNEKTMKEQEETIHANHSKFNRPSRRPIKEENVASKPRSYFETTIQASNICDGYEYLVIQK